MDIKAILSERNGKTQIEDIPLYTEKMEHIGGGGTKSALLIDCNTVVMVPNTVDGISLIKQWPRIVEEEILMSKLLSSKGVPTLQLKRCNIHWKENILPSYTCRSFSSYLQDHIYIVDCKSLTSTTWPHDNSVSFFESADNMYSLHYWLQVLSPLIKDVFILRENNISLGSDSINLAIAGRKSSLNTHKTTPYVFRLFLFDLSSKSRPLDISRNEKSNTAFILSRAIELAVWEAICPNSIYLISEARTLCILLEEHYTTVLSSENRRIEG